MKKRVSKASRGQATVEYILLFGFMALVGINMARTIGNGLSGSVKSLGYVLTQELSTGVCRETCFFSNYANGKN